MTAPKVSIFIKTIKAFYADQDKQQAYKSLWDNHLKSVITEYLRGTGDESSKFDKLKAAYDNGKTQNNG